METEIFRWGYLDGDVVRVAWDVEEGTCSRFGVRRDALNIEVTTDFVYEHHDNTLWAVV